MCRFLLWGISRTLALSALSYFGGRLHLALATLISSAQLIIVSLIKYESLKASQ
jgi:hypothetical protein